MMRLARLTALLVAVLVLTARPARALPTMIRLGYTGCVACHYAPQGGGPLNPYGRSIDEAQSLRAGEYRPLDNSVVRALSWNGRIAQDLRVVFPMQRAWASHEPASAVFRPRLQYRNYTELPLGFAVHVGLTGEPDAIDRPTLAYEPASRATTPVVNVALLRYRASPQFEIAAGRDQLPSGVNLPELSLFARERNRLGYYDSPAQIKADWSGGRYRVVPFVYAPGGNEVDGVRESGGGALAELDPIGNQRAVVGINILRGTARDGGRRVVGAHARLGFGSWGILAEHDVTDRDRTGIGSFRQHTSFGQVFWAAKEWLVASGGAERLQVAAPFAERVNAGRVELTARLTAAATAGVAARIQRDELTRRVSRSLAFQLVLKTVY
jgi:hypothetical protein